MSIENRLESGIMNRRDLLKQAVAAGAFLAVPSFVEVLGQELDEGYTVVIDPGHGGRSTGGSYDRGTWHEYNGQNYFESDIVLDIAKRVERILRSDGLPTAMTRTSEKDMSLSNSGRVRLAKSFDNPVFVSLHCNTALSHTEFYDSLSGAEAIIASKYKGSESIDKRLSEALSMDIMERLEPLLGYHGGIPVKYFSDLGRKIKDATVLRDSDYPAAIIEIGFLDSRRDSGIIIEKRQDIAQRIALGIKDYLRAHSSTSAAQVKKEGDYKDSAPEEDQIRIPSEYVYIVKPGTDDRPADNLYRLKERIGTTLAGLKGLNFIPKDTDTLYPDQKLNVGVHIVGYHRLERDTVYHMERLYGVDRRSLRALNPSIGDNYVIHPGQQIKLWTPPDLS
jgi:N-acetylmuramoyl-L-alanine amidase